MDKSADISRIYDYFVEVFKEDDDFRSYERILIDTGIECRAMRDQAGYFVSMRAREMCTQRPDPFLLEPTKRIVRGLVRVRIGLASHLKSNDRLRRNRNNSMRAIGLNNVGLPHAIDDSEALMIKLGNMMHGRSLMVTSEDAMRNEYTNLSNGLTLEGVKILSLRDILRRK